MTTSLISRRDARADSKSRPDRTQRSSPTMYFTNACRVGTRRTEVLRIPAFRFVCHGNVDMLCTGLHSQRCKKYVVDALPYLAMNKPKIRKKRYPLTKRLAEGFLAQKEGRQRQVERRSIQRKRATRYDAVSHRTSLRQSSKPPQ
jgi:hypothetical protein